MEQEHGNDNEVLLSGGEQRALRVEKLDKIRSGGYDPFAIEKYVRTHMAHEVANSEADHWRMDEVTRKSLEIRIAGRVTSYRSKGKVVFFDLSDESGRVQVYARKDDLTDEMFNQLLNVDLGDYLGIQGFPFITRTGEPTLHAVSFTLLTKALRPVPTGKTDSEGNIHGGLADREQRYRQRYLDLIANPASKEQLIKRCRIVSSMRRFLDAKGFLEVETPVLQVEAGGAAARPFLTHHNALNYDFKLRISLELYLKKLIIGGLEKVYEIGRVFRNEGISTRHNPEFTLMELYHAYVNLEDIMELVEEMYESICVDVNGTSQFGYKGQIIDLSIRPWKRLPMLDGISQYAGIQPDELTSLEEGMKACEREQVSFDYSKETSLGGLIEKLHEVYTQPNLIQPTFITDFPVETSPLAKRHPTNPQIARRFEIYIATQELGNAFSELNDPIEQRARFENQLIQKEAGDDEAHPMDEEFIEAMEYGMPPTGGLGIGIDRLAMTLTEAASIRDVILFPLMRPHKSS